jgi:hypothetical protein
MEGSPEESLKAQLLSPPGPISRYIPGQRDQLLDQRVISFVVLVLFSIHLLNATSRSVKRFLSAVHAHSTVS